MTYLVIFQDNPAADPGIRRDHMAAHLGFLETHADQIVAAGPLSTLAGQGAGGAWVVDCDTPERVQELIEADPFWPTGLRQSHQILAWTQVYANGKRLIDPS